MIKCDHCGGLYREGHPHWPRECAVVLKKQIANLIELGNALVHNVECSCIEKEGVLLTCGSCCDVAMWKAEVQMIEEGE